MQNESAMASTRGRRPEGIFGGDYRWVSLGMCVLILISAFEALAVTTVMPTVSAQLHGESLYALAFAGPLATGVIGMVLGGNWADRTGPRTPLYLSSALFVVGLAIVGFAPTMPVLVIGRLVQGLGSGAVTVALYVVVARVYPPSLHRAIFAAFSAAWVVPSLVGPFVAGLVAEHLGWRWVFLGVIALIFAAVGMVVPALRSLRSEVQPEVRWQLRRVLWAVLAAVAVLAINLSADATGPVLWIGPVIGVVVVAISLRPLLPPRTLLAGRGLPSVVLYRGLVAGAFFGAEVYVPYLLTRQYDFAPSIAGLALTGAALMWSLGSWLQSRFARYLDHVRAFGVGASLVIVALGAACATAAIDLPPAIVIAGWAIGGLGMGIGYPTTSVATLEFSTPTTQGFNSSGLSIADSIGASISLALTAIVFTALDGSGRAGLPFAGCFALMLLLAVGALFVGRRVRERANRGSAVASRADAAEPPR
jgi:MFS family permease